MDFQGYFTSSITDLLATNITCTTITLSWTALPIIVMKLIIVDVGEIM